MISRGSHHGYFEHVLTNIVQQASSARTARRRYGARQRSRAPRPRRINKRIAHIATSFPSIRHLPLFTHGEPKDACVFGGGARFGGAGLLLWCVRVFRYDRILKKKVKANERVPWITTHIEGQNGFWGMMYYGLDACGDGGHHGIAMGLPSRCFSLTAARLRFLRMGAETRKRHHAVAFSLEPGTGAEGRTF